MILAALPLGAQQFFYDSKRDQQAQAAVAAAKDIASGSLFDRMLRNAERQLLLESGTMANWQKEIGRASLDNVVLWNDPAEAMRPASAGTSSGCVARRLSVSALATGRCASLRCRLDELERNLAVDTNEGAIEEELASLKGQIGQLSDEIKKLKEALRKEGDQSILAIAVDQLEMTEDLFAYANKLAGMDLAGKNKAIGEIGAAVEEIKKWTIIVRDIWIGYKALQTRPGELIPMHQQLDLQLLKIESDRLTQLAKVYGRLHLDTARVRKSIREARKWIGTSLENNGPIDRTLEELARPAQNETDAARVARLKELDAVLIGLHFAAQALAEADLSVKLCSIREGGLIRQSDLRRSSAEVTAREAAAFEGLQRLALYYKSGIKPSELATLLFSIAGAGAFPASLVK